MVQDDLGLQWVVQGDLGLQWVVQGDLGLWGGGCKVT